jgi:hypothetical protein
MRKSTIMGSWKRLGLERLIHPRRCGLFVVPPLAHPVAPGLLTSSDGLARIVARVRAFLASRLIRLPDGNSDDPVQTKTVHEVALVGVASGRAGLLGRGPGVEGVAQADAVRSLGVDVVVADRAEVAAVP